MIFSNISMFTSLLSDFTVCENKTEQQFHPVPTLFQGTTTPYIIDGSRKSEISGPYSVIRPTF